MHICDICGNTVSFINEAQICQDCLKLSAHEVRAKKQNAKAIKKAAEKRQTAKTLGLKALKGTAKQKAWGEELRAGFLSITTSDLVFDFLQNSESPKHAKFWIENRNTEATKLHDAIHDFIKATQEANKIGAGNKGYDEQLQKRAKALELIKL